jgi:hypothetical protein
MGTPRVHMKGVIPCLVRRARHAGTRVFCPTFAALAGPVQNIFFLTVLYFTLLVSLLVPIAQQSRQGSGAGSPVS